MAELLRIPLKTWREFKRELEKARPFMDCGCLLLQGSFLTTEVFVLLCWAFSSRPCPLPTAAGCSQALTFSLCPSLAVFQSPSPGSSSPLGAESSSTPLHPGDPAEASSNKEVGSRFVSEATSPCCFVPLLV